MADEVVLLGFWASPFDMRVRMALELKQINYEIKEENLQNKSDLLLQMNPSHKKIPVLIHNGKPICESLLILQYIDEIWSNKSPLLLPADPYNRAVARFWADYVDKKTLECARKICFTKEDERQEEGKIELMECLKLLEGELGEKPYFGGEEMGLVDVVVLSFYAWFYCLETFGKFSLKEEFPKLIGWGKKCMEKESVAKIIPEGYKLYEHALGVRKRLGVD